MSEEGNLLNVSFQEFFDCPPPQKQDFLAYWLATGFPLPEGNYCVRSNLIRHWFPDESADECFRVCPHLGFMYNFFTNGYCPFFLPIVANFGRQHHDQRSVRLRAVEAPAIAEYLRRTKHYGKQVLREQVTHVFRNCNDKVIGKLEAKDLRLLRRQIWQCKILGSPLLHRSLCSMVKGLRQRMRRSSADQIAG
jgi:hypothetical protein